MISKTDNQTTGAADKIMIGFAVSIVMMAIALAYISRSWEGYLSLMGLALLGAVFSCSWTQWRQWRMRYITGEDSKSERADRDLAQVHLLVVATVLGAIILFLVGLAERLVWANSSGYPAMLLQKDFIEREGRSFDVNQYRLFTEIVCKERGPMEIKDNGEGVYYLRCGTSFPESKVLRVRKDDFDSASAESKNFKAGDPIVIHNGHSEMMGN